MEILRNLTNVTILERPAPMRSVVSAVQAAVRARQRQYEIRRQIDAIRSAEARALELQQQLTIALDASELGTFSCPFPLERISWNERTKAHFWLPPDAEIDFSVFYSIIHPQDRTRTRQAIEDCVDRGVPYDIEYRTVSPAGEIRWVRATGNITRDEQGRRRSFDGTTRDVTLRRLVEEERDRLLVSERTARIQSEQSNRLKDEFLATLSHELRTPLNAIFGWVELLKESASDADLVTEATRGDRAQRAHAVPADRGPPRCQPHHLRQGAAGGEAVQPERDHPRLG